jgi:putative hemolysin
VDVAIILALILLNGVFAMAEIALITSRKARLQAMVNRGDAAAAAALRLGEDPTRFLSTIQIGITSIGILNGILGEAAFEAPLRAWLRDIGLEAKAAEYLATGIIVALVTYFSIVLGELVPKRLGQINPEGIARVVARPMQILAVGSKPFGKLLSLSTELVLAALGMRARRGPGVTQDEIHALLVEGSDAGVIDPGEHAMLRNVLRLDRLRVASLMVPRARVVALDVDLPWEENVRRIRESGHSRFPVVKRDLNHALGVLSVRRLLTQALDGQQPGLTRGLRPALHVREERSGLELLEAFRASGAQLALVVAHYGEVIGIVTLRDLMEAITGELAPPADESDAVRRADGSWLLDGLMPIHEVCDRLGLRQVPEEERAAYHTLSGMVIALLGHLPATGEQVNWMGWRFEVVDMDGRRIDKVLASELTEAA